MVVEKFWLTVMWKLQFNIRSLYCDGTVNVMSKRTLPRSYGSPCMEGGESENHHGCPGALYSPPELGGFDIYPAGTPL